VPCGSPTHYRQYRAGDVKSAKHVGGELAFDRLGIDFLEWSELTVSGVVDQHIDAAKAGEGGFQGGLSLCCMANVQLRCQNVRRVRGIRLLQPFKVEIGGNDDIARSQPCPGNTGANTTSASGNELDFAHSGMSCSIQANADVWCGVQPSSSRARFARTRLLEPKV
jgi:hypothetical protein